MRRSVLLDTGPLVAFLNHADDYHAWAAAQWDDIIPPLLTCEAVVSEACFLLGAAERGPEAVLSLLRRGVVVVAFQLQENADDLARLLARYGDAPMSLADGCLVRMSEIVPGSVVFTVDQHFRHYRRHGRQVIPKIMPDRRDRTHGAPGIL